MIKRIRVLTGAIGAMMLAAGMALADGDSGSDDANYCMDVNTEPFHMMPGFVDEDFGACAVRDYRDGELQEAFYPFTIDDHLFNCEAFGDMAPLPTEEPPFAGIPVPSSVVSQSDIVGTKGVISGTIGGHAFSATLYCASLTNASSNSQLAQPFLKMGLPFPRVTEVSVFDGVIMVERRNKTVEVPIVLATRAAGITHLEQLDPPQVGASVSHSALGMLTYKDDGDIAKELGGSLDLLLQGHIFSPKSVEDDPGAAVIKGVICSKGLYKLLNK